MATRSTASSRSPRKSPATPSQPKTTSAGRDKASETPKSTRKPAAPNQAPKPAAKTAKPAKKSIRLTVGKAPTGKRATSKVVKGSDKLPPIEGAEVEVKRSPTLHIGAAIARRGKKGRLTNEQRRMLARAVDGLSPLEFAASVLRDEEASQGSRQWAAEILMPYLHHRLPTIQINHNSNNANTGVLVAPADMPAEEWIAKYGATPADVVDLDFKEVTTLTEDGDA